MRIIRVLTAASTLLLAVSAQAQEGTWVYSEAKDAVTDLPTARAAVRSMDGSSSLVVKCDGAGEPVVSVQLIQPRFLGTGERKLTYRFDELPAVDLQADYTSKVAYTAYDGVVVPLAALLKGNHRVLVRAWDYRDQPVDVMFQVAGGKEPVEKVLSTCHYPLEPTPVKTKK